MKTRFFKSLALFLFSPIVLWAQQKVYMPYAEAINMHYSYQHSISRLLQSYVDENGKYQIILPAAKPGEQYNFPTDADIKAMAQKNGAAFYLKMELNRIGENVIVSVNMYKTETGIKTWSDRLKAATPEDLDPIMKKVANNLGTIKKATDDADIYNVTQNESQLLNKKQANYGFGFSIMGGTAINNYTTGSLAGFGIAGSYDTRNLIFDMRLNYMFSSKDSEGYGGSDTWTGSMECYYPFKSQNTTPFIGGGLGISTTSADTKVSYIDSYNGQTYSTNQTRNGSGLMLIAGGGFLINRNSNVNLRLGANLFASLYEVGNKHASGLLLKAEILF